MEFVWKYLENFTFDANCMNIGFLYLKILRFYVFKMAANGGRHLEMNNRYENYKTLFLKSMPTNKHLTNVILVYCVSTHFMGLFSEYCTFISYYWKIINIHCELVTT